MNPQIIAAARALAAGDLLGVLNRLALRDDASALALLGVAMAWRRAALAIVGQIACGLEPGNG